MIRCSAILSAHAMVDQSCVIRETCRESVSFCPFSFAVEGDTSVLARFEGGGSPESRSILLTTHLPMRTMGKRARNGHDAQSVAWMTD